MKLQTRIAVLRQEDMSAHKKIDDTRRKADEMLKIKKEKDDLDRKRIVNHKNHMLRAKELV